MQTHACSDSGIDIINQAQSTSFLNVLSTERQWLGTAVKNPNTILNYQIASPQDILCNTKKNARTGSCGFFSNLCFNIALWIPNWPKEE